MRRLANRWIVLVALLLGLVSTGGASACEKCVIFLDDEWCRPVSVGESGKTTCSDGLGEEQSCCCSLSGNNCTLDGGGGGGTGGGSGGGGSSNPCETTGYCPAQCFSCGGSGGGGIFF